MEVKKGLVFVFFAWLLMFLFVLLRLQCNAFVFSLFNVWPIPPKKDKAKREARGRIVEVVKGQYIKKPVTFCVW